MNYLLLVVWTAALVGLGTGLTGRKHAGLAKCWVLGVGVSSVVLLWLNLAGVPLTRLLGLVLLFPGLVLLARRRLAGGPQPPKPLWLLPLLAFACLALARAAWEPLTGYDARIFWARATQILFYEGSIRAPGFTDPHRGFPMATDAFPLLPLTQWQLCAWTGLYDDHLLLAVHCLFFLALLQITYDTLLRYCDRSSALLTLTAMAGLPLFWAARDGSVASGYADVPLACIVALAVDVALSCLLKPASSGQAWLLALALAMLGLSKRGGVLLAGGLVLGLLAARTETRRVLVAAGVAIALCAPWLAHQHWLSGQGHRPSGLVQVVPLAAESERHLSSVGPIVFSELLLRFDRGSAYWWGVLLGLLLPWPGFRSGGASDDEEAASAQPASP